MPNSPVEVKAGQVWERDACKREVRIIPTRACERIMYIHTGSNSRRQVRYATLEAFQRWTATAKLVKEGE